MMGEKVLKKTNSLIRIIVGLMGLSHLDKENNLFGVSSILIGLIGIGLYYLCERKDLKQRLIKFKK